MIAFHSTYPSNMQRRAQQITRLHILREDGRHPRREGLCGTGAYASVNSEKTLINPLPPVPPRGLTWCPKCLGIAADRLGLAEEVVALIITGTSP